MLEVTYPFLFNFITEGKFWYDKNSKTVEIDEATALGIQYNPFYISPGLYLSLDEILIAMCSEVHKKTIKST